MNGMNQKESLKNSALFDYSDVPTLFINAKGTIVELNQSAQTLLGYSKKQLASQKWYEKLLPNESSTQIRHQIHQTLKEDARITFHSYLIPAKGKVLEIDCPGQAGASSGPSALFGAGHGSLGRPPADGRAAKTAKQLTALRHTRDERAPGATTDAMPGGTPEAPRISLSLWADEPLGSDPVVVCFYGTTEEPVTMFPSPPAGHYTGEVALDLTDPYFDGRGLFEITLCKS